MYLCAGGQRPHERQDRHLDGGWWLRQRTAGPATGHSLNAARLCQSAWVAECLVGSKVQGVLRAHMAAQCTAC